MTLLTSLSGLAALAALLPFAGRLAGARRADAVRRALRLPPPPRAGMVRPLAATAGIAVLGFAAAQPALTHTSHQRVRSGVEALFVIDTSRSMAASRTPASPTRLDRAIAAAVRLRAAVPDVPSGVATLTDRVLPDLDPVADVASFDAVAQRAVAIESPPPADTAVRATTYAALGDIASGGYFAPRTARRLIVLLTDGESNPVDTSALARTLRGYRFVAVRIWNAGESVYDRGGRPEAAYRPDPLGRVVLAGVARALGGAAFEERDVSAAAAALRRAAGTGPTTAVATAEPGRTPLAPYLAALALVLLLAALVPRQSLPRALQSGAR
jgi:hypothetical protein